MAGIPPARDTDAEDVSWALQTAETQWKRNERADALIWLRRATQAAADANDDDRALELARCAAELAEALAGAPAAAPPPPPPLRPAAPPPLPARPAPPSVPVAESLPPVSVSMDEVEVLLSMPPASITDADIQSLPPSAPPEGARAVPPQIPRAPAVPQTSPPRSSQRFPVPPQFRPQLADDDTEENTDTDLDALPKVPAADGPKSVPPRPFVRGQAPVRPPMPTPLADVPRVIRAPRAPLAEPDEPPPLPDLPTPTPPPSGRSTVPPERATPTPPPLVAPLPPLDLRLHDRTEIGMRDPSLDADDGLTQQRKLAPRDIAAVAEELRRQQEAHDDDGGLTEQRKLTTGEHAAVIAARQRSEDPYGDDDNDHTERRRVEPDPEPPPRAEAPIDAAAPPPVPIEGGLGAMRRSEATRPDLPPSRRAPSRPEPAFRRHEPSSPELAPAPEAPAPEAPAPEGPAPEAPAPRAGTASPRERPVIPPRIEPPRPANDPTKGPPRPGPPRPDPGARPTVRLPKAQPGRPVAATAQAKPVPPPPITEPELPSNAGTRPRREAPAPAAAAATTVAAHERPSAPSAPPTLDASQTANEPLATSTASQTAHEPLATSTASQTAHEPEAPAHAYAVDAAQAAHASTGSILADPAAEAAPMAAEAAPMEEDPVTAEPPAVEPPRRLPSDRPRRSDISTKQVFALAESTAEALLADLPHPALSEPHTPVHASQPPAAKATDALVLDDVDAFSDLPEDARDTFAKAAKLARVTAGEEVAGFALAYVVAGDLDVAATIVDATATRLTTGGVLRARGTPSESVPLRLVCTTQEAIVAVWSDDAVEEAFRSCPWVEDDLRAASDQVQTLAGVTMGPLGDRIDGMLRDMVTSRLTVRSLLEGELVVEEGAPVPGLVIVGVGKLELLAKDTVIGEVRSGDFLFPEQVLGAGPAPHGARAGAGGALVMSGNRKLAQELLVTVPPLLEILAGM